MKQILLRQHVTNDLVPVYVFFMLVYLRFQRLKMSLKGRIKVIPILQEQNERLQFSKENEALTKYYFDSGPERWMAKFSFN